MQMIDERQGELQHRFAARNHDVVGRKIGDLTHDLLFGEVLVGLVLRIAEIASEIAASKANKDRRSAGIAALALNRVENFVYSHSAPSSSLLVSET